MQANLLPLLIGLSLSACKKPSADLTSAPAQSGAATPAAAAAGMCKEVCTEWCAEHGVPESQCLQCNSKSKITKPPTPDYPMK